MQMQRETWTRKDAGLLEELLNKKQRTYDAAVHELGDVVQVVTRKLPLGDKDREAIRQGLIENAGAVRDALEPFDDGTRVAAQAPVEKAAA